MRRLTAAALAFVAALGTAFAQQRPQYTQYVLNNYLSNPAVGGIESYTDLRSSYRSQWVGIEGAPESMYVSVHAPLGNPDNSSNARNGFSTKNGNRKSIPHHGIGAVAQVDRAGLLRASTLNASYSYHQPLSRYLTLASGISSGFTQYSVNTTAARGADPYDPYLAATRLNKTKLDLNLGFWLYSPDFYIGLSGTQLLRNQGDISQGDEPQLTLQPHFYGTAGMRFQTSDDLAVVPSVMVKTTDVAAPAVDLSVRVLYARQLWGGASYRLKDAWAVMAGINLNHLIDVGYAYEVPVSGMNQVTAGGHEVVVGFKINNRRKVLCPQWVW